MTPPVPAKRHQAVQALINVFDWYPSHYSSLERKLLRKLDCSLLVFASLSFFCKYLDQSNITNSYVSGMKEDVGLTGNALNRIVMFWTLFYVIGQIPMIMLQSSCMVPAYSRVTKPWHIYLLRSLLGFMEAPSFGATHFLLGSWYKDEELFKRAGTWFMAGAYKRLNGVHGLAGWRWLFIIDGRPWYMSPEEHQLATDRLPKHQETKAKRLELSVVTETIKKPTWIYIFLIQAHYWTGYMALWLKSEPAKWSIPQIDTLPTMINLIQAFSSWFGTSLAGTLSIWKMFSIPQACMVFSLIVLTVWNVPQGWKFAAFYVGGVSGATSPILYSWLNTQMRDAPESRAFSEWRHDGIRGQIKAEPPYSLVHSHRVDDDTRLCWSNLGSAFDLSDRTSAFLSKRLPFEPRILDSHVRDLPLWFLSYAKVSMSGVLHDRNADALDSSATRSNAVRNDVETTSEQEVEGIEFETPLSSSPVPSKSEELVKEVDNYPAYVVEKR
ncbi:hypothetical protein QFC20_002770 [Naganishia adeliensis]|uniref:Uncharacterized protein n=1 Tax=Naganishia adeliensis TaxID=92952 RepID=A0ACC2WHT5_9TREE|nr:hypothetical protein QFC20_002770 [Naganishia adeliensis]